MKTYSLMIGIVALIFVIFIMSFGRPATQKQDGEGKNASVALGDTMVSVELVKTAQEQERGLSYRTSLPENSGMLFVFQKPDFYTFWMPHMNFPLDMIWMDEEGRVVSIDENASPLADLQNPKRYTPSSPAQYVLEVNAGFAKQHHITIGDGALFQNIGK